MGAAQSPVVVKSASDVVTHHQDAHEHADALSGPRVENGSIYYPPPHFPDDPSLRRNRKDVQDHPGAKDEQVGAHAGCASHLATFPPC